MSSLTTLFAQFTDLNLGKPILKVLAELGYETPSPIQAAAIPEFLSGRDVLGQAQTGTGKTAAFALPILANLDLKKTHTQALVLAPTRELAIQVAEAFQRYATYMTGFQVLPIYGGQSYGPQLAALRRGAHVVVGTPGRVIDHLEKGTLDLSKLKTVVLDEADEMLRMGFIDEVETILQKTPDERQTALFSATMPQVIKRMTKTYLRDPAEVTIAAKTGTADNIRQRFWVVSGMHKLDALTRILEAEAFDGMIIFARTKLATEELANKLQARGFSAAAINGDMAQPQRERTIEQLKKGKIDILVATDVAARGLDVDRISHVVNYDVPYDPESYTHRIGRTGRAGRSGEAILFITPKEKGMLRVIERATRQPVSPLTLPTIAAVNEVRITRFKEQILATIDEGGLDDFYSLVQEFEQEQNIPAIEIAAALAKLARGDVPLLLDTKGREEPFDHHEHHREGRRKKEMVFREPEPGMATFRLAVGHAHRVKPGNIVGAIANESGLSSKQIGRIEIYDDFSTVDLPDSIPKEMLNKLKSTRVGGQRIMIEAINNAPPPSSVNPEKPVRGKKPAKADEDAEVAAKPTRSARRAEETQSDASEANAPRATKRATTREEPRSKSGQGSMAPASYRIEVGKAHQVKPAEIVQVLSEAAGLTSRQIGRIDLYDQFSVVDIEVGLDADQMAALGQASLASQPLQMGVASGDIIAARRADPGKHTPPKPKLGKKKPKAKASKK